jgi:hypothetical protein
MPSLEMPPTGPERRHERRWALAAFGVGVVVLVSVALAVNHLRGRILRGPEGMDQAALPAAVRAQVMLILDEHLLNAKLLELREGPVREFRVQGSSRAVLAQDFYKNFRPVVVDRLMPLLRPYGEITSFDIASLDLPPARLRPLPKA